MKHHHVFYVVVQMYKAHVKPCDKHSLELCALKLCVCAGIRVVVVMSHSVRQSASFVNY